MFDAALSLEALRGRRNSKWTKYGPDVIPCWIAEMDFSVAPSIQSIMERMVAEQDYGYPLRDGDRADLAVSTAFVHWMKTRFGWETKADLVQPVADLVQATFAAIMAFTKPGDGVMLHLPAYGPFHEAINSTGRRMVVQRMRDTGQSYDLDLDEMTRLADHGTRMMILCNPQNPTGHVFSRAELEAIGALAVERDMIIVSDEIHADLVFEGRHIPMASLSPEIAARTITLNSATKSFNIPGLRCAVMHFGTAELRDRFLSVFPRRVLGAPSVAGIDATVAAWREGAEWLDGITAHLKEMRDLATDRITREAPGLRVIRPEATYMLWVDCTKLGLNEPAFAYFLREAGLAFNAGEAFDPECAQFVRFNFATSRPIVEEICDRLVKAAARLST